MRVLGALLAGGRSSRFGSDKALALLAGRALIDHAAEALSAMCETLVICGRADTRWRALNDRPHGGLGPLGGLCAALAHGKEAGFDAVLSAPCDVPDLPADLLVQLTAAGPTAVVADLPVIGLWPCALASRLDRFLAESTDRSLRAWARAAGAAPVALAVPLRNINTAADLAALCRERTERD